MAVVNNGGRSLYFAAAGDVQAGRLIVDSITWSGATTETHTMTMKNSSNCKKDFFHLLMLWIRQLTPKILKQSANPSKCSNRLMRNFS